MRELTFHTLDVFTDRMFGGNQLAVFPEAPELDTTVMQSIAREFNLSETVFVRPTQMPGALRQLRIFTPEAELPFAVIRPLARPNCWSNWASRTATALAMRGSGWRKMSASCRLLSPQ